MKRGSVAAELPLVGRREELALLHELRSATPPVSAVVSGPAGVGKSRLVSAAVAEAEREGWATLTIRGSAGYGAVPLGPLRSVFRASHSNDLPDLTATLGRELLALRSGKGLLVLADDAHSLDDETAGLLHQMVATNSIILVATARSGAGMPPALVDVWKDGLAERVELQSLSEHETTELLLAILGAAVEDSSANRIWRVTDGNPLYVNEVVLSSLETGALREVEGEWRWRGQWAKAGRLREIVAARLGRLDPDELTAMELLALAGSLPVALVTGLTTARAVEGLELRGLVATEMSGRRLELAVAHPLHAEVLRGSIPALRERAIRRNLVDALKETGMRRVADRVRLACWSVEVGLDVDHVTLSLGSDAVLFGIGHALAARLAEIMPGAHATPRGPGPVYGQDDEVAVRLARGAYEMSGGVPEGVELAAALAWTGATEGAEAVLAELSDRVQGVDELLRLECELGWLRFWCRHDAPAAETGLLDAVATAGAGADSQVLAAIYQELAGIALNTARPADALAYAERAAATLGIELAASVAAPPATAALGYLGRLGEALALADSAVPLAFAAGKRMIVATLLFARATALARRGDLAEARTLAEWLRGVALEEGQQEATANFGIMLGEVLLRQGRPASAGRIFRDSAGLLAEKDVLGYRPWALYGLARARARTGDLEAATAALEEGRRTQAIGRHFDWALHLAQIEVHTLAGRRVEAERAAAVGAAWAGERGMLVDEAVLLDAWLRVAPSAELADRLSALANVTDSTLVAVMAEHAQALVTEDPARLETVAERFAAMEVEWMAAEAAGAAARHYERRNMVRAAKAAARRASDLAARCEGATAPLVTERAGGGTRLTKREQEIARLVAAGRSTREIAETMYLSPRTVENHLYRAYVKLGVTDRATLSAALDRSE